MERLAGAEVDDPAPGVGGGAGGLGGLAWSGGPGTALLAWRAGLAKWLWIRLPVAAIMAEVVGERARGEEAVESEVSEEWVDMLMMDLH